ncbi:class I SAM-dependent methyltransferase [Dokdonella koreensis]|uniref:Phospholipid N-methyltransferase n=1 Tax=Dokdonella koreensis DS-123 TaxID=1300342 RepID=A0A160DT04_9GAMM|nr:methyltransferase domain-containing protein [Dokdonella koreensis]ANB17455.1 Phospholipid N-methyltransferase [Dokdonella koreensis DS-123]
MSHFRRKNATAAAESPVAWTFFRQWLKNPLSMAAFSPSGKQLARAMVSQLPPGARRIVELGGGTGVFTRALLDHGIRASDLLVVELNEPLHRLLQHRFPGVHVVRGDARRLTELAAGEHFLEEGPADAVVSGLGLLSMSRGMQRDILNAAFSVLAPHGRFIQFTYGPVSPVSRELLGELGLHARRGTMAWINVPPATVYTYTRSRSTAIPAQAAAPR